MKLLELLNLLLSFGPKLPAILAEVEIIVAAFQRIADQFSGGFGASELTGEEAEGVNSVMAAAGRTGEGNSGPLSNIFAWLKANPEIMAAVLKILLSFKS